MKKRYKILYASVLVVSVFTHYSCNSTEKYKTYINKCMDQKSILWTKINDERFQVLCQYKPIQLCSLLEVGLENFNQSQYDSALNKYQNMISYNLYLSDYFDFPSGEILNELSSSPTLSLETFLSERLQVVTDDDTLSNPIVHVVREKRDNYNNTALVYFQMDTIINASGWELLLNIATGTTNNIKLSSLKKEQLLNFNSENL
ncbi:MAG: hypothetical protein IPJ26_07750 [Bacteroidetes bacterium]|nr:hypothetical protein [Bacteroidota bacterium]